MKSTNVTIDVKDADIARVLEALSQQTGLSVVSGKDVVGQVTARLVDVPWDRALEAVLKPNGYGYELSGSNIVIVLPLAKIQELTDAQPLTSKVFKLRYVDANDLKPLIDSQLSPRGKAQVLQWTGQKGWDFGAFGASGSGSQASRSSVGGVSSPQRYYKGDQAARSKSKTLVVTDIQPVLDRVAETIDAVDIKPKQVLIESKFMEVNRDLLRDLGVDYGTGSSGASTAAVETVTVDKHNGSTRLGLGGQVLGSLAAPSVFGAKSSDITSTNPFNTGLSIAFKKFTGTQFDVLLHALEENVHTNTLSAPSIMTLDNQEANILVGTQFPILTSSVAGTTSTTTVSSLDYYQDIGVQLRVVPQIVGDDSVNMIVHPAVSSITDRITAEGTGGVTAAVYPVLTTREAETQILMHDGETVMIGGMLQDSNSRGYHKVPILGDIPVIGYAFRRQTDDGGKIDLLVFITAKIAGDEQQAVTHPQFVPQAPGPDTTIDWQKGGRPLKATVKPLEAH